jgi:hypothetical protein
MPHHATATLAHTILTVSLLIVLVFIIRMPSMLVSFRYHKAFVRGLRSKGIA